MMMKTAAELPELLTTHYLHVCRQKAGRRQAGRQKAGRGRRGEGE